MNIATSVTIFQDAVGMRLSVTYSEVDDQTGRIVADNKRLNRVVTNADTRALGTQLLQHAQSFIDEATE